MNSFYKFFDLIFFLVEIFLVNKFLMVVVIQCPLHDDTIHGHYHCTISRKHCPKIVLLTMFSSTCKQHEKITNNNKHCYHSPIHNENEMKWNVQSQHFESNSQIVRP